MRLRLAPPCPCLPACRAQIYNEAVRDLLQPGGDSLQVQDVPDGKTLKVQVAGMHEQIVAGAEQVRGGWAAARVAF